MKKPNITEYDLEKTHPAIPEAYDQLKQGRISRREFLRFSTLLGMSAGAAQFLAACGAPEEEAPAEEAPAEEAPAEEAPADDESVEKSPSDDE